MEKYKKLIKNKVNISSLTWTKKLELPYDSYSVSDIQDYFQYIVIVLETVADNPPIKININKVENRITYKIMDDA